MRIVKLGVETVEGGNVVSISAFVASNEELQADDVASLLDALRAGAGVEPAVEMPPAKTTETDPNAGNGSPTTRRGRGRPAASSAPAETAPSDQSADAGAATGGGRRGRRPAAAAPAAPAAPAASAKISNMDLAKAMGQLAEAIGKDEAFKWMSESYAVERVMDIPEESRAEFLDLINQTLSGAGA